MAHALRLGLIPAFLFLCLVLGGASAAGFWENMALQLLAIPIIAWAMIAKRGAPISPSGRHLLILLILLLLLILVQLIPLPPSIWTALPGRGETARAFELLGQPLPWLPISLAPAQTLSSLLWLLPAFAVLFGIVCLGNFKESWIAWVVIGVAGASVAIGALQIAGGVASPWYFYRITNYGATTGFFANANHMATLLVVAIPFLAALYLNARRKGHSAQRSSGLLVILAGSLAVLIVGLAINTSLAGLGLMVPVLAASLLMIRSRKHRLPAWSGWAIGLLLAGAMTAVYFAPISNNLTSSGAHSDPSSRYQSFRITGQAAFEHLPVGSGIGTFREVYRMKEDPAAVNRFYMNHAHSDYVELLLETGLPGALLLLLFLLWWFRRVFQIWRAETVDLFALAATIASAAILAHSMVDYPLRTAAISAVFAACCALMAEPRAKVRKRNSAREGQARHLSAD